MFGGILGSKKFLGVDIGTSTVRVVEISKKGRSFKLENYGEVKNPVFKAKPNVNFMKDKSLSFNNNIAEAIRAVCGEAGIQTKQANFSIPDFRSFFTSFKLPTMAKDELAEAVKYEVRPYIPLPLSEITLDWLITEGQPAKTPLKILVVAIPNEIISQYQSIANLSGLKLKALESEVFSLSRTLISRQEKEKKSSKIKIGKKDKKKEEGRGEKKEIIGLIDIGAKTSTCSVSENRLLKISHSFSIAGNELTNRLAKSLNIDYNKAKELINKYGLSNQNNANVRKILIPLINSLLENIKKTFYSFSQAEDREINRVVLAGGLAFMPGLKEYFSAELGREIVISNPFANISCPPILEKTLRQIGPAYAISVGLAMKGLE